MKTFSVLSSLLLAANTLAPITSAAPLDQSPDDVATGHEKRQSNFVAVTGVPNNGVQVRQELRTLQQKSGTLWALYLLGLQSFKAVPQTDPLSYYQIAAVHGRPYRPWGGSPNTGGNGGYCPHVSNMFGPWHVPYLALFEQQLYIHVQNVAKKYSANAQAQAKNFRIPYWDWAAPNCNGCKPFPSLISDQWAVITIDGKRMTIENPLFRYKFTNTAAQRASDFVFQPFTAWTVTKRAPDPWDASASSFNSKINPQMASAQAGLRSRVYTILTSYDNFTEFSNEAWIQTGSGDGDGKSDSLESVHDAIHSITGQNGHMTYLDYSAFDPVFWLHHANVDRLFMLWRSIHGTSSYVQPMAQLSENYWFKQGQVLDVNTYLAPFRSSSSGGQWTSKNAGSPTAFRYTYPELISGKSVISQVNALYGSSTGSAQKRKRDSDDDSAPDASSERHYTANIVSQKFNLQGSYGVWLFIGEVPDDVAQWSKAGSNLVGTQFVLANLNASADMDMKVTGSVPLTAAIEQLVAAGKIEDTSVAQVEPYLRENMSWRVVKSDGTQVPVSDLADLSVSVVTAEYTAPKDSESLPVWGKWTSLPNCTSGLPGGHDDAYWDAPVNSESGKFSYGKNVALGFDL